MEKFYLPVAGFWKMFLQIGNTCSEIEVVGSHVYYCCGKSTKLYLVDYSNNVECLVFEGGYPYCVITRSYGDGFIRLHYHVFTRKAGANPRLVPPQDFSWRWISVL